MALIVVVVVAFVVVALLLVGDSLVMVVVAVGAIALPPLRLSAVEISMGCMFSSLHFPPFLLHSQLELRVLQTFAQLFFVDSVSLIVTATQIACYLPPLPSLSPRRTRCKICEKVKVE